MKNISLHFVAGLGFCKYYLVIILSFSLFLFSCNSSDGDTIPPEESVSSKIETAMTETQAEMEAPGWMVGIWTPTESYESVNGLADISNNTTIDKSQLIRIGSITKTFTATLVLILCDEGKLNLDDKLSQYLPDYSDADLITIKQLLMHKSGIVSWDENDDVRMSVYNGTGDWTIDKLIAWGATQPLLSEPGTEFHYSNNGYFILGKIIEQASGMTVAQAMEEKIVLKLGLNGTFMAESPCPDNDVIHGYDASSGILEDMTGTSQAIAINYELAWTAGGILSTLEDLHKWSRAVALGELISDSLHQQQLPVLNPPNSVNPYWSGYGMGISQTEDWIGHTGAVCGYICNMSYNLEDDVTIVTFFNKFCAFDKDANTSDINAVVSNFMILAKLICPDSLKTD